MEYNNHYKTNNLGLATALVAIGAKLVRIDKTTPTRAVFVFDNDGTIEQLVERYWSNSLEVSALTYFDTIKQMKSRLYS